MPGINISRSEAFERSSHLAIDSYEVFLDVSGSGDTFFARSTVKFSCNQPGYDTFIDAVATRVISATLNNFPVNLNGYDGETIFLASLAAENELIIEVEVPYSKTGEGLQKSVDPVDNETYLYSQGETAHIRNMFPCFDQPDLKATFSLSVLAPQHWEAISNNPVKSVRPDGDSKFWEFTTTPRIPTYLATLVAGPYSHVHDEYVGEKTVPLGIYCRKSLAESLDPEEIFGLTKAGFAYFEKVFGLAYPFDKYDQAAVLDFNAGAMENAGIITFREESLIFRSRVTEHARERRASIILHEMAHMWFGDMVTMSWWDDLWLNESFAEWISYLAVVDATKYKDGWTSFIAERKSWAYKQDQLISTHPIAVAMDDIESVNANFDGISYAKGASALHQLSAFIGFENFVAGLREYFAKFAWKNTQLSDLLTELSKASGRDLTAWSDTWLKTAGINTLRPLVEEADGKYTKVSISQEAPKMPVGSTEIRPHHLNLGVYDLVDAKLTLRKTIALDISGELTQITELENEKVADLLLLNDGDLGYAKIRFDERSLQTVVDHLTEIDNAVSRYVCWMAIWDMWRDAEFPSAAFAEHLLKGLKREPLINLVTGLGTDLVELVEHASNPAERDALRTHVGNELQVLLLAAEPGSDRQLQYAKNFASIAFTDEQITLLRTLLHQGLNGLEVDRDMRWFFAITLAEKGAISKEELDAILETDATFRGELNHQEAVSSLPDAAIKAATWNSLLNDPLSNWQRAYLARGFMRARQVDLMKDYVDPYFASLISMWESNSYEQASKKVAALYPRYVIAEETLNKTDNWLQGLGKETPAVLRRLVSEGRDSLARELRIQQRDGSKP